MLPKSDARGELTAEPLRRWEKREGKLGPMAPEAPPPSSSDASLPDDADEAEREEARSTPAKGKRPAKEPVRSRGLSAKQLAFAVGVAGLGLWLFLRARGPGSLPPPQFHLDGRRASSEPLGLALVVPAPWTSLDLPQEPGLDFAMQHPITRAVIIGYGLTPEKNKIDLDATLKLMLEEREKKWGSVSDVAWGNETLGDLAMRTVAFTLPRDGGPVRNKIWTSLRGSYVVGFTCSGAETSFPMVEKSCRDVLDHVETQPGWRPRS